MLLYVVLCCIVLYCVVLCCIVLCYVVFVYKCINTFPICVCHIYTEDIVPEHFTLDSFQNISGKTTFLFPLVKKRW